MRRDTMSGWRVSTHHTFELVHFFSSVAYVCVRGVKKTTWPIVKMFGFS
jgi:hypothetical protein